ncbi:MAG: periplasmic sensor signal transduction histidine kinase, partial [Halothiobacillaceae bacterium]
MKYKQSLRFRITFSFVIFVFVLTLASAVGVNLMLNDIEEELIYQRLQAEMDHFVKINDLVPDSVIQIASDTKLYFIVHDTQNLLNAEVKQLTPGLHAWSSAKEHFYILVGNKGEGRLYLAKETTDFENREEAIKLAMIVMVIAVTSIALWLGRWISGKVILPVSNLAQQVASLKPSSQRSPHIALQYAEDEVGRLAASFDQYLQQMQQFIHREQEFTADASHELRTPLAVIKGASELLLETPDLPERAMKQVERIARAAERMSHMLEILLLLAREAPNTIRLNQECCLAQEVVLEVAEQHRFL